MTNYQLLALDLDETLLTQDKRITDETKLWISRAIELGVVVVFATGRGFQKVGSFYDELKLNSPMVLVNGAEVWKKQGRLLNRQYISREDIRMLYSLAMDAEAFFWGYSVESLTGPKTWNEEMFHRDWMKFGIKHDDHQVIKEVRERVSDSETLEITSSSPVNVEFSLKGVSKESGIRRVCEYLDININDVMAIGDNLNDFRLIHAAGLGLAMGNADARLKEIADKVTATNEQDGVAKAIQRYIFGIT